jgi:prepilin-type N-terminal cleavage/methylation domain-containing protein
MSPQLKLRRSGFTLIEIMIVVAIMAIVMTMSVPIVYRALKKESLNQAVRDIEEVCANARARAIMSGTTTEVVFHPKDGRLELSGGGGAPANSGATDMVQVGNTAPTASGTSANIPDGIIIEMLDINLFEYKDSDFARARFHPNGTCDELTIILHSVRAEGHDNERWRKISYEVTTGLASVETDPNRWR